MNGREQRTLVERLVLFLIVCWLVIGGSAWAEEDPRVALVVLGDAVFAGAFDRELDDRLRHAGFEIVDVGRTVRSAGPEPVLEDVVPVLQEAADLLVGVEIHRLSERELSYFGRQEWLITASVDVRIFLLPTGSALEGVWSEDVEYTEATTAVKAERSFSGLINELAPALRESWSAHLERQDEARAAAARAAAKKAATKRASKPRVDPPPPVEKPPKKPAGERALEAYESEDFVRAAELWATACDDGEIISCYNLGLLYLDGAGQVGRDPRRAAELFQQACDGDEPAGCFNLGAMYDSGEGIPRDPHQSASLFRQACQGGAEAACFNLGLLYFTGEGVLPLDLAKAGELFRQSCDGGYAAGCFNLGTLYMNGDGGFPQNDGRAAELFQRACDGGEDLGCVHRERLCESRPELCE